MTETNSTLSERLRKITSGKRLVDIDVGGSPDLPAALADMERVVCKPLPQPLRDQPGLYSWTMGHVPLSSFAAESSSERHVVFCTEAGLLNAVIDLVKDSTAALPLFRVATARRLMPLLERVPASVECVLVHGPDDVERTLRKLFRPAKTGWALTDCDASGNGLVALTRTAIPAADSAVQLSPYAPGFAEEPALPVAATTLQVAVMDAGATIGEGAKLADIQIVDDVIEGIVTLPKDAALPIVMAFLDGAAIAAAPPFRDPQAPDRYRFEIELPRRVFFDSSATAVELRLSVPALGKRKHVVTLPNRRIISAERLLDFDTLSPKLGSGRKPLGIVLYTFTRTEGALLILESLKRQGALDLVEVWMDGDQGKPALRQALDAAEVELRDFGVKQITRHRGNLGFRKIMLQSLSKMVQTYDRFIVLEDDCFPNRRAIREFTKALDAHEHDQQVLTTYGHHFLMPSEDSMCPRFQGWGWATWSDKFAPFLEELIYLYSLSESDFKEWAAEAMTPEILERIDATPPRKASDTLRNFFAWDEALTLISAVANKQHAPTAKRCIYNFGVGDDSTHFMNIEWYRKPPFNMILKNEVWEHF